VGPDETYFEPVLHRAVEISEAKPSGPPGNDQLERLRAAVRQAHDRLTFERMQLQGPPSSAEEARLEQHAVELAATIIRGLNDCLNTGALTGYVAINEKRVLSAVLDFGGGQPHAQPDDLSEVDPVLDGWLVAIAGAAGPLRLGAIPDPGDLFVILGRAGALASVLAGRRLTRQSS
jgi:hypothetical protein